MENRIATGVSKANAKIDYVHLDGVDHLLKEDLTKDSATWNQALPFSSQLQAALRTFAAKNLGTVTAAHRSTMARVPDWSNASSARYPWMKKSRARSGPGCETRFWPISRRAGSSVARPPLPISAEFRFGMNAGATRRRRYGHEALADGLTRAGQQAVRRCRSHRPSRHPAVPSNLFPVRDDKRA
jgi:hypothetical protein